MARRPPRRPDVSTCRNCGGTYPPRRLACPHCGSDAKTGWKAAHLADHDAADIPDTFTDDDYEDVLRDLPGGAPSSVRRWSRRRVWVVVAGLFLVAWLIVTWVLLPMW